MKRNLIAVFEIVVENIGNDPEEEFAALQQRTLDSLDEYSSPICYQVEKKKEDGTYEIVESCFDVSKEYFKFLSKHMSGGEQ